MQQTMNPLQQHPGHIPGDVSVWPLTVASGLHELMTTGSEKEVNQWFSEQVRYWIEDEGGLDPLTNQLQLALDESRCPCQFAFLYNLIIRCEQALREFRLYRGIRRVREGNDRDLSPETKERQRLHELKISVIEAYAQTVVDVRPRAHRREHPLVRTDLRGVLCALFSRFVLTPTYNGTMYALAGGKVPLPYELVSFAYRKHSTVLEQAMRFSQAQGVTYSDLTRPNPKDSRIMFLFLGYTTFAPHNKAVEQLLSALTLYLLLKDQISFIAALAARLEVQAIVALLAHIQYWPPPPITAEHRALTTSVLTSAPPAPVQPVAGA